MIQLCRVIYCKCANETSCTSANSQSAMEHNKKHTQTPPPRIFLEGTPRRFFIACYIRKFLFIDLIKKKKKTKKKNPKKPTKTHKTPKLQTKTKKKKKQLNN